MGVILERCYDLVEEKLGLVGKMEVAAKTKLPSTRARGAPDSPENLELFRKALMEVIGEVPRELLGFRPRPTDIK